MNEKIIKNYPSPRLMETIGATNQKPEEAIGELVANSFDARNGDENLRIIIDISTHDKIIVIDNGVGMSESVLEKAVCIAEDMSKYIERGDSAKGHFGMGFKTSCSTLGRYYEIFTRPKDEKIEYHVEFDISDYSNRPSGKDAWDIKIEYTSNFKDSPLKNYEHGSAFVINNLKEKKIVLGAILKYLGEAFKGHIENGDEIIIKTATSEEKAIPKKYSFVPGTKIIIDEYIGGNKALHITGWAAIDKLTHNDGFYGFNIYRKKQLVEKWDKSWFPPHLMTSRIIGEVNMDFLEATFYKQGIQQAENWGIIISHMKDVLKPLVNASRNLSKKHNIDKPAEIKKITEELSSNFTVDNFVDNMNNSEDLFVEQIFKTDKNSINDKIKNMITEKELHLANLGTIKIDYLEEESNEDCIAPYDYLYSEGFDSNGDMELTVIKLKGHSLWSSEWEKERYKIIATSDAIHRMLVEKLNYDPYEAYKISLEWMNKRIEKIIKD